MAGSGSTTILITGVAGFIGFHLSRRLLSQGHTVLGVDNVNDYYDVGLKNERLRMLKEFSSFRFFKENLADQQAIEAIFRQNTVNIVINLAAQAGVRYSLVNPQSYVESNVTGFVNMIDCARRYEVSNFIFASSSSVYGANTTLPFSVKHHVDHPLSLYAATKKANEMIAHSYASSFHLPVTGLRFFSVYGPWGRPDMALFLFTKHILNELPIDVYNNGDMVRDFTYVDDVVEAIVRLIDHPAKPDPNWSAKSPVPYSSFAPYRIFNIGNKAPMQLLEFIKTIEKELGKKAKLNYLPMQMGDVPAAIADAEELYHAVGYQPSVNMEQGIHAFIEWYKSYYK